MTDSSQPTLFPGDDREHLESTVADTQPPLSASAHAATLAVDITQLRQARALAVELARRHRMLEDRLADLEIVVGELTSNSVRHGGGRGELRVWAADGHLVCEVRDRGQPTDPLAMQHSPRPGQIGGWGLALCRQLADRLRIHTSPAGTTARASFRLPPRNRRPQSSEVE